MLSFFKVHQRCKKSKMFLHSSHEKQNILSLILFHICVRQVLIMKNIRLNIAMTIHFSVQ